MDRKIILPRNNDRTEQDEVILVDNLVIVGANGSGKSRLGSFIERYNGERPIKRISAQRMLSVPHGFQPRIYADAVRSLIDSSRNIQPFDPINDYELVITTIFAQTSKRNEEYVGASAVSEEKLPIPESSIDKLLRIWNNVLPQRQLHIEDDKIFGKYDTTSYLAREMSDGEKVCLYLIAQCLVLPEDCIVIIDEPEIHVHKALLTLLWNTIEAERPDCIFVYITHDLDFAASRVKSKKIWVKAYVVPDTWELEELPEESSIPENLLLEIIGSRKPILFVEGERGSYDHAIYQHIYSDFTIMPRGGCSKVIESVKGMRANSSLHSIQAYGLIDRDYRSDEEITALRKHGIYVIDFSEVENILLTPALIRLVANNQALNEDEAINEVQNFAFTLLEKELDTIVSFRTSLEIAFLLNKFDHKQTGEKNIGSALEGLATSIDVKSIYAKNEKLFKEILENKDYVGLLKLYNNKGLLPNVSGILKLSSGQYPQLILRLLDLEDRQSEVVAALKSQLPKIE